MPCSREGRERFAAIRNEKPDSLHSDEACKADRWTDLVRMKQYYTDRKFGERPTVIDTIDERLWAGLHSLIGTRIGDGSFGYRFPDQCPDERGPCGCDSEAFGRVLAAEVPWIDWPLPVWEQPGTPVILDLLEFCAAAVGTPIKGDFHSYYGHFHLSWDRESGLLAFVSEINLLFKRNGIAYELTSDGQARRTLPQPLANALSWTVFSTGDAETNRLLEGARHKIVLPKIEDRRDALEKLWDAFERLKTLEPGPNKRQQAEALLDRCADSHTRFRQLLGDEAAALTKIGNSFRIRHSEVTQEELQTAEQVDYLFARLFAFIRMVLKATERGG